MEIKNKVLSITLYFIIAFCCIALTKQNTSYAWSTRNLTTSNVVINDGKLNSIDLHFDVPEELAETTSWVGLQTKQFNATDPDGYGYGDLTDEGTICEKGFTNTDTVLADEEFCEEWGIEAFNSEGFSCFGQYSSINVTFSELDIDLSQNQKFYVYLWTSYNGYFYPDALVAVFEITDEELVVTEAEYEIIEEIEIENANLELKVGKAPTFSAKIKDDDDRISINETFMSLNRNSTLSTDDEAANDEDGLVKDYKYFYILDLSVTENSSLRFGETTKFYINGVEKPIAYLDASGTSVTIVNESEVIIPEDYIELAELDEDFAQTQNSALEKIILQAIKDGKVKYREDEAQEIVKDALNTDKEISIEIEIYSVSKSCVTLELFDEEAIDPINDKIENGQKFGTYYVVNIIVYVDGNFVYRIADVGTAIPITIPLPNGLPKLENGYERVWKVIRYHNGETEVIDAKSTDNGISFLNGKFSEFATAYEDVKIEKPEEDKEQEETKVTESTEKVDNLSNPKTGDNILIWVFLIVISALGIVGTIIISKKK